jgi:hypothetical protein
MGHMTIVSVLCDAMDTIKEHPDQFVNNISEGMHDYGPRKINSYGVGNHANPMMVHHEFHDMLDQLILVGHGYMTNIADMQTGFYSKNNTLRVKGTELAKAKRILDNAYKSYMNFAQEVAIETVKDLHLDDVTEEAFGNILQEYGILDGIDDANLVQFIKDTYNKWKEEKA